ncbi:hypothetical protein BD779DRAFT_477683 [Infundibulicybe gibba]|nr:hypothetical protein BD779DRAFT_477683 [Infundibulicybe gibba]
MPPLPTKPAAMHIPHDIWVHIAQFIPALALRNLFSVNRTFFHIAMDYRYRQISFAYLNDHMLRSLVRLKDPVVARRVRVLHVYPGFINEVLDKENTKRELRRSFRHRITELATHILSEQKLFAKGKARVIKSTGQIVQAMLEVLGSLPNVTDYHIMWCGLPAIQKTPAPFLVAAFQSSLRKLSLDISLENIQGLMGPSFAAHNLEELDLMLRVDSPDSRHNRILVDHLAPALNQLRFSLRTLAIQSWEPLDLSPLFDALEYMPYLDRFTVAIPIEYPHLGSTSGLTNLLNRHGNTLSYLQLRGTQFSGSGLSPDETSIESWVTNALADVHIAALRSLEVSSHLLPIESYATCLSHFAHSITSLTLTGRYHTFDDVALLIGAFDARVPCDRLESLRLGPVTLTPELVDLLAFQLPWLDRLELIIKDVVPHEGDVPSFPRARGSASLMQDEYQIDEFFSIMEQRIYPDWHLRRLNIAITSSPCRMQYEAPLEQLFARCIPSIRGFYT